MVGCDRLDWVWVHGTCGKAGLIADKFQPIACHLEAPASQLFMQARIELRDQIRVKAGRQVVHSSGSEATKMIVQVPARIVPRAISATSGGEFGCQSNGDPCLEGFINRGETNFGKARSNGLVDVFGGRMFG